MAPIEANLVRQARRAGDPIPDRILTKPKLGLGLDFFLEAFFDLENERAFLMGDKVHALPIPWRALNEYAVAYGVVGETYDEFMFFMRALDTAYVGHANKKA
jgi:hypothetical protein